MGVNFCKTNPTTLPQFFAFKSCQQQLCTLFPSFYYEPLVFLTLDNFPTLNLRSLLSSLGLYQDHDFLSMVRVLVHMDNMEYSQSRVFWEIIFRYLTAIPIFPHAPPKGSYNKGDECGYKHQIQTSHKHVRELVDILQQLQITFVHVTLWHILCNNQEQREQLSP